MVKAALRGDTSRGRLGAPSAHEPVDVPAAFRSVTGVSPLQYQKQLRLQEARQLMLNEDLDAGSAAGCVGYASPSQFSREYSRLYHVQATSSPQYLHA